MKILKTLSLFIIFAISLNASNNAFVKAGQAYKINPKLLWAIAYKESRFNTLAINKANKNKTYDIFKAKNCKNIINKK